LILVVNKMMKQKSQDISIIKMKIKKIRSYLTVIVILNIFLFIASIYHFVYNNYKLKFDIMFILIFILNIVFLILLYRIFGKHRFYIYQYKYFSNQNKKVKKNE